MIGTASEFGALLRRINSYPDAKETTMADSSGSGTGAASSSGSFQPRSGRAYCIQQGRGNSGL